MQLYNRVEDVKKIEVVGIWPSKSGGELVLLFDQKFDDVNREFFQWEQTKVGDDQEDIRGLRIYMVRGIPAGTVGANEYQEVRREKIWTIKGKICWTFEDLYGGKAEVVTEAGQGIEVPPYVMHSYTALEGGSDLFIVANGSFSKADLIEMPAFKALQSHVMGSAKT